MSIQSLYVESLAPNMMVSEDGSLCEIIRVRYSQVEKAVAPHCSTLAWKIPWTEVPGRLRSMGSLGVRQD